MPCYSIIHVIVSSSILQVSVVQIGFATVCLAAVAAILSLAEPVIDNTIAAFPYEESGSGYYNP